MTALIRWFLRNPIAVNLLVLMLVAAGALALPRLRREIFPSVPLDAVSIAVSYPGAAPDEVEESISVRVEEAIEGLDGVRRIRSISTEGYSVVTAEVGIGANMRRVISDVENRLRELDTLPTGAGAPVVQEIIDNNVVMSVAIYGDADEITLREVAQQIRDDIAQLPESAHTELAAVPSYEISIELSESEMRGYGSTFDEVVSAVERSSVNAPGGVLETSSGDLRLRSLGRAYHVLDFASIPVRARADGTRLLVGDVARVIDGLAKSDERARFDGQRAAIVRLLDRDVPDIIVLSRAVRARLARIESGLPRGISVSTWLDQSSSLESRIDLMLRNAASGFVLVVAVLTLFLGFRVAFWVAAGIPVAFMGALALMSLFGVSVNMISLFGFIVALGLIVDDAIVVGEQIELRQASETRETGALQGALATVVPVSASVLTTLLFMVPILFLPTMIGKISASLGIVIIACLVFSLVESYLVLPSHLAHQILRRPATPRLLLRWGHWQREFATRFDEKSQAVFASLLDRVLRVRLLTVAMFLVALWLAVATTSGGWVSFDLVPRVEADHVTAEITFPDGTPGDVTEAALGRMESAARELGRELDREQVLHGRHHIRHVMSAVGNAPDEYVPAELERAGDHFGVIRLELDREEGRRATSLEIAELWRERVGDVPGALSLRYTGSEFDVTAPIEVELSSMDAGALSDAAADLAGRMAQVPGLRDIVNPLQHGKDELRITIRPEAEAYGLSLADAGRQVQQGFFGTVVQRFQRGGEEVTVRVRYPESERRSLRDFERVWIRTADGSVPIHTVAELAFARGQPSIERADGRRTVSITADEDPRVASARELYSHLESAVLPAVLASHPGVSSGAGGRSRDEALFAAIMAQLMILAIVGAYTVIAVTLRSYLQPVLILLMIPFGFVGAVAGHALLGLRMSGFSLVGMIALGGVVVNDGVVLLHAFRRLRADGLPAQEAVRRAACARLRPILLTSLTTFFGLLPMLMERSAQAAWLKPMAVTLSFGIMAATATTLVLLPVLLLASQQFEHRAKQVPPVEVPPRY